MTPTPTSNPRDAETAPATTSRGLGVGPRSDRERRRFELYCRWTVHALLLMAVFLMATSALIAGPEFAEEQGWSRSFGLGLAGAAIALGVVWGALGGAVTELGLTDRHLPRWLVIAFGSVAVLALVVQAGMVPSGSTYTDGIGPYLGLGPSVIAGTVTVAALMKRWTVVSMGAGCAIALMAAVLAWGPTRMPPAGVFAAVWSAAWFCVFLIPAAMLTRWMIDVVQRLWQVQQVVADLAVAEERLRFSRDLHDVFGRTLSTVALKSELAAELAKRGDERAVVQMQEVRELVQTSLSDMRGLVRGYRRIELADEVAGARSVLRAAGMRARTTGFDDLDTTTARIGEPAAEALAWAVRESVTNVLRHAQSGEVRLDLTDEGSHVRLTCENELSKRVSSTERGTGLLGLRERVEAVGGTLESGPDGEKYRLSAHVPVVTSST